MNETSFVELPIITETTFTVTANGENGPSRLSDLINQYRMPMWVDEIRISAIGYGSDFFSILTDTHTRILFGQYPITNEFVPTGVLAPRWPGDGHVVIRLQKPLYITPQDLPVPTIRSTVGLTVRFSLVGRLAQPLPQNSRVWIPYITAFEGSTVSTGDTSSQQSNRTDLANPFRSPMHVRFLIGQRTTTSASVTQGLVNGQPPMNVRVTDYLGRPVVRDPTPFFSLFNLRDQAWVVNSVLPFGGYFLANVDVDATDATEDQEFDISMFGYREEQIQWGT